MVECLRVFRHVGFFRFRRRGTVRTRPAFSSSRIDRSRDAPCASFLPGLSFYDFRNLGHASLCSALLRKENGDGFHFHHLDGDLVSAGKVAVVNVKAVPRSSLVEVVG